jgi:transposase
MIEHTTMSKVSRLEVIQTGARRRWTPEEKRRIVAESAGAPRLVSATARRYGLSAGQLFTWRRLVREGRLGADAEAMSFAQAVISCESATSGPPACPAVRQGRLEIVLGDGIRVIVDQGVDAGAVARLIVALERR